MPQPPLEGAQYPYEGNAWFDEQYGGYPPAQYDLEESLRRQDDLLLQTQNLTAHVASLEQREELHIRQLEVLTERIIEVEAAAASDRTAILEYQANCTEMGKQIAVLEGEVEEWRNRCSDYVAQHETDEAKIAKLQKDLKKASRETEDFAALIERHRLSEEGTDYRSSSRPKKKKRGFFAWLFGWGEEEIESNLDEAYEEARTTLLKALQTERNSVHELETAVASLQQNNSAISEQVESRNLIIEELNDRIAVFEEDKVVLKAALKQLQKEMGEEAPRTQKIVDDLAAAKKEVKRLQNEIKSLVSTHQGEIKSLKKAISAKEDAIHQTESNLTAIGTYVDRLESRLGEFAVARRDIEIREEKCKEVEAAAVKTRRELEALTSRAKEMSKEQEEVKTLLKEMAEERVGLQAKSQKLIKERDSIKQDYDNAQQVLSQLRKDYDDLANVNQALKVRVGQFQDTASTNAQINEELTASKTMVEDLMSQLDQVRAERQVLVEKLKQLEHSSGTLHETIRALEADKEELARNMSLSSQPQVCA